MRNVGNTLNNNCAMYIGHDIHSHKWCWYDSLRRRLRHRHECVERSHKQCEFVYMHIVFKLESTTYRCFEILRTHDGWLSVRAIFSSSHLSGVCAQQLHFSRIVVVPTTLLSTHTNTDRHVSNRKYVRIDSIVV